MLHLYRHYISLVLGERFDIYGFTETWLKSSITSSSLFGNDMSEYEIIRCDRVAETGRGVAFYAIVALRHP